MFSGSKVLLEKDWKMVFAVVKKDGAGKRRPKQNATENTRKKEKAQNSKFSRRAKNYGAIRQAV